jgi:hypothetical protein
MLSKWDVISAATQKFKGNYMRARTHLTGLSGHTHTEGEIMSLVSPPPPPPPSYLTHSPLPPLFKGIEELPSRTGRHRICLCGLLEYFKTLRQMEPRFCKRWPPTNVQFREPNCPIISRPPTICIWQHNAAFKLSTNAAIVFKPF